MSHETDLRIALSELRFGIDSRDRRADTDKPGIDGALAALETFYHALNNREPALLAAVLSDHPLAQLNNPLGGILRGGDAILDLYVEKVFGGGARVEVEFADFVQYVGPDHAVFAGRERGTYTIGGDEPRPLSIRTSRYFGYEPTRRRWLQFHHHGSIDDPGILAAYQRDVLGTEPGG